MTLKQNVSKGFTLIGVMVSIIMLGTFSMIMLTSTNYFNENQIVIQSKTDLEQESQNKLLSLYEVEDWKTLTQYTLTTPSGDLIVDYQYNPPSAYYTESLDVSFTLNTIEKEYTIERSVIQHE